ncbi:haloacid dehalogenase superfamily, subfamily IA, variant 3 with third motif having DD or ED/beta-phosphoglucomutase family hydrolase [Aeromonas sp. RU39B]|mgnify:CR=1 FL=1|jgi:beta-phosphoglucomutase family hydrolase|uniref:HAD family hydrolase n=1 Tax=Aeromonas sp. RU39B TaxID=1907416 RepID=UPI0009565BE3|nr:beta-phosphoglucomutase family hydrolase [Aeromonas sp. RU39B]SIR49239.1 haloacid dehalogenase superfamily, subfamily IA, variant 3 with third motif having DD or ED/beta-phosphoglucomutase family hydrolase [Aeromonas sp. RU39B]
MLLTRFSGLIFDLDGTLVDSMPLHLDAWRQTALEFGFRYDGEWLYALGGVPSRKIAVMLGKAQGIEIDVEAVTRCKTKHYVANMHKATAFPAMKALVEAHFGKVPMAIGTGSPRVNAEAVLRNAGLDRYFPVVITADDVDLHKPNPDTFLLAAQRLGVKAGECLVFEDTGIGEQAAHSAGMACVLVSEGIPQLGALEK